MTEQTALSLVAATIGFVGGVFLCIGSVLNSTDSIVMQSTPFWDFEEPRARAIVSQRAQYTVGGLLLVISFGLQIESIVASSVDPLALPEWIGTWPRLVFATLLATGAIAWVACSRLDKVIIGKVLESNRQRKAENAHGDS